MPIPLRSPGHSGRYTQAVAAIDVVDSSTVRFQMATQDVSLPARLSGRAGVISSPANLTKWGADYATPPVGTGPFQFVEWVKNDHVGMKRFDGYWATDAQGTKLPYLEGLNIRPIIDQTVK